MKLHTAQISDTNIITTTTLPDSTANIRKEVINAFYRIL